TSTNNRISALYILGNVGGSALGSMLLSRHVFLLNGLGVVCSLIALGFNAFIPPQLGRSDNSRNALDTSAADLLLQDEIEPQTAILDQLAGQHRGSESMSGIVFDSWRSSLHSITTLFQVPRPTFTIIWIFLLYSFTTRVEVLNYQYISLTLGWSLATVNSLLAGNALLSAVILFVLPTVRKIYLEPQRNDQEVDLLIVKGSLLLNAIGMAGFAKAKAPADADVHYMIVASETPPVVVAIISPTDGDR
ncbi:MAG: hypothetical protein Q9180_005555, partial [Flavoplaca navasiana]